MNVWVLTYTWKEGNAPAGTAVLGVFRTWEGAAERARHHYIAEPVNRQTYAMTEAVWEGVGRLRALVHTLEHTFSDNVDYTDRDGMV